MKIAISGKGGVGKTTIMALLANEFKKAGKDVLIIDADPSPHMAETLGVKDIEKIRPIAEMTRILVERSGKVEGSPFYNMNPQVNDLLHDFMISHEGMKLMVLGAIQVISEHRLSLGTIPQFFDAEILAKLAAGAAVAPSSMSSRLT